MNQAFIILVIIICIAVWFLASALYKPIGKFVGKVGEDAIKELTDEEKENEET